MFALFGRTTQLAAVDAARRDAEAGRGQLLLVTGEAGIGKSVLAQEALDRAAADGFRTARGYAVDDAGAPPLWPWTRVGRDLSEVATVLPVTARAGDDDATERFRLGEGLMAALAGAAEESGLLVLLEDFHWADPLSVAVLRHVTIDLPGTRAVVVVTARDTSDTPFGRALPPLARSPATVRIALAGLDVGSVRAWLSSTDELRNWLPLAEDLVERTSGNPFYIRALTSHTTTATGPPDLTEIVAQRGDLRSILVAPYQRLTADERRTVATAALLAERLSPGLVAAATATPTVEVSEHLATAVTAGLLRFGATGLSFTHALVRDAIIAGIDPQQRADAHAAIAASMEAAGDATLVGPSAVHWDRAAGATAAARCQEQARLAATQAAASLAPEQAVEFADLAVRKSRSLGDPPGTLASLVVDLARYQWAADLVPDALRSCTEAADLAESSGRDDLLAAAAAVPQGIGSIDVSRIVDGLCRRALARTRPDDLATRARLMGQRAVAAAEEAVDESADELSVEALALARRSANPVAELETIAARHLVLCYPQALEERTRLAARAVELAPHAATTMGALWGHLWQADIALQRASLSRFDVEVAEIERISRQRSAPVARWHWHRLRALTACLCGDFDDARGHALEGRRLADRIGDLSMLGMYMAFRIHLAHLRGEPDEIPAEAAEMLKQAPPIPLVQAATPLILAMRGEFDTARASFESLRGVPDRMPLGPRWAGTVSQIGLVASLLDDADVARNCYRLLQPCEQWCDSDGGGAPFSMGSMHLILGQLAQTIGDLPAASRHFEGAVAVDTELGARPSVALARLSWAECLTERQTSPADAASAHELASLAAADLRRMDLPGPLARAEHVLDAELGFAGAPSGLTPREVEVAELVAQALTNKQIADRLFLSVRTVESHVRSVLGKLQLTTRTELAVWIQRQPRTGTKATGGH